MQIINMSLQQPLLDHAHARPARRQSVLWSNFRVLKPQKHSYERRVGSRIMGESNKNVYVYEGERPAENSLFTELEASNLSFLDNPEKERMRKSQMYSKNIEERGSLDDIKEESSAFLSEENLIGRSSAFVSQSNLMGRKKSKQLKKEHLRKLQSLRKVKQLTIRQRLDAFFGDGINSLILTLPPGSIKFLSINIFLDIISRGFLLFICLAFFFTSTSSPKDSLVLIPIAAMLFSRVIYIMTLIKLNFGQKSTICVAYQKSFDNRSYFQIQNDRLFRRHYNRRNLLFSFLRSLILPQISYFFIKESNPKLKIYFLMCMIFKGIEIMMVLPLFVVTLIVTIQPEGHWNIVHVSYVIEETVRYVVNFLIINTLSK